VDMRYFGFENEKSRNGLHRERSEGTDFGQDFAALRVKGLSERISGQKQWRALTAGDDLRACPQSFFSDNSKW